MPTQKSDTSNLSIDELIDLLSGASTRKKKSLISEIEQRAEAFTELQLAGLSRFDPDGDDWIPGWIMQILYRHQPNYLDELLQNFPKGWLNVNSQREIDYSILQQNLLHENFEEADRFTSATLRKLAGPAAEKRGYVYFSEVDNIPQIDLISIDRLWMTYSQGKFGFSIQSKILETLNGRYELLWPKIGWKNEGVWTRYPGSFDWSINAPDGHMPLINQLRGVRLMDSILNHPGLQSRK